MNKRQILDIVKNEPTKIQIIVGLFGVLVLLLGVFFLPIHFSFKFIMIGLLFMHWSNE